MGFRSIFQAVAVAAAMFVGSLGSAEALPTLNGSISIGALGYSKNNSDLANSTVFAPLLGTEFFGVGAGDFAPIAPFTPITDAGLDLNNLGAYSFTSAAGNFGGVTLSQIVSQSSNFLDVYLEGIFTPAGVLAGFGPGAASVRFSLNLSGQSVGGGATLTSPPAGKVPEPATLALLGAGLTAAGMFGRRKAKKSA